MHGRQPRHRQGRPQQPESRKWLGPLGRLPRRDRGAGLHGRHDPDAEAPRRIARYRPGSESQRRNGGHGETRAAVTLTQGRAPVDAALRSVSFMVCRLHDGPLSGRCTRLHIGAGQTAKHRKVKSKEQGQNAHRGKGTKAEGPVIRHSTITKLALSKARAY
jgi:hypothetical protein